MRALKFADLLLDLLLQLDVILQQIAHLFLALTETVPVVGVPGARLLEHIEFRTDVDDFAETRNALAVQNIELHLLEGRRNLILDDLHLRFVADHFIALLDRADAADVKTNGAVELQRIAAGSGLRIAVAADLHADLVDEDDDALRAGNAGRKLAKRLRHQTRLKAGQRIAHHAFNFVFGRKGGHRVDDDQIDGTRTHQRINDFESLFARIRLRKQQVGDLNAETRGVLDVERVLGIDEGAGAARLLHFCNYLERERRLARGFRPEDLNNAALRKSAHAEREVERQRPGRADFNVLRFEIVGHAHDGALAELLLDAGKRYGQRLFALIAFLTFHGLGACAVLCSHDVCPYRECSFHPFK